MKLLWLALSALPFVARAANSTNSTTLSSSGPVLLTSSTVQSTILVIARDASSASSASSGLNGYGIPFQVLLVPQGGTSLPALNSSSGGNFGGIIVASAVSYDYGSAGYQSALTTDQWNTLFAYQTSYGVRMVQYDVYPGPNYGATALGGCCGSGVEQLMAFTNTSAFTQAGLKVGAGVSTQGLYHYPASITNTSSTTEIAQFAANANFNTVSTAAVINNFSGRQQMVFFIGWATDWSATSNYLQHAYITWMTRGLYAGIRRVNLNTQIDDMFLGTDIYYPSGTTYRTTPSDMAAVASWVPQIQAKMNTGSYYRPEIGHNGNGNILAAEANYPTSTSCTPGSIDTGSHNDTALEFQKPLGSGTNAWPSTPTAYGYSAACNNQDPLKIWFQATANRDAFMHISHTFTHYELNNSTYSDALKEIQFNQAWMQAVGISAGNFTSNGLIPPAITGLHNGDAIKAWNDAGLTNCVGDNTRPVLRNPNNNMYALTTTASANGYDGYFVIPRWATRIYYNCDTANCTTTEWINTSAGSGTFDDLMAVEKSDTMRHLFALQHDGYMFHQANLRSVGNAAINVNGQSKQTSIFQAWVETMVAEFTRLVNWPMQTLKQSDLAISFANRQARDACGYSMSYNFANSKITGVTVTANSNTCSVAVPLTVPGTVVNTKGMVLEKIGNDPLTIWVKLSGSAQTFTLSTPVPF